MRPRNIQYTRLNVKEGSYLLEEPESVEAPFGGSAEFKCLIETDPSLKSSLVRSWKRNGQLLALKHDKIQTQDSGTKLIIQNLNSEDSGRITCFVKTSIDSLTSKEATLSILRPTKIVEQSAGVKEVSEGSDITHECRARNKVALQ